MICFPNIKINLGLHILGKRKDGFHNIETVFYPVHHCYDILEVLPTASGTVIKQTGLTWAHCEQENICVHAYKLLKKDYPQLPNLYMHLHKHIPTGAGLGGGSADGLFTLKTINSLCKLGCTDEQILGYAQQLGSDCSFFMYNTPCIGSNKGEILEKISVALDDYKIILIKPNTNIPTAWAYAQVSITPKNNSILSIINRPVKEWPIYLINDFEKPIYKAYPELATIKDKLYNLGAHFASLSGSGSTLYGIFDKNFSLPKSLFPTNYWIFEKDVQVKSRMLKN
ncbi:MAG: 4-(cytidine 5'-diphospho)-2-C-methyl-D-erythritol kinase [Phycisphaerales bacterium]|nr:4-(cytidine 5'-diphospho)-2-C-methyl-D-erythritol kinase [Phycisphaerales bacterium]